MKATIEKVIMNPTLIPPIIVNFEHGEVNDKKVKKLGCNIFYDSKKEKRVLGLTDNNIVYKGYQPDSKDSLTYTMFALHNKKTGKVRLIQTESWNVAPIIHPQDDVSDEAESDHEDYETKASILNKKFGSKKMKRQTELYEKISIDKESMATQLEVTATQATIKKESLSTTVPENLADSMMIPPCNREANAPEDVYDVNDIIPHDKLLLLVETVDVILKRDLTGYSEFYTKTLKAVMHDRDSKRKIAILEYINGTCNWLKISNVRVGKKKTNEICPTSPHICDYIVQSYSTISTTGRVRPVSIKDKAVIHCLILALNICDFKLDLQEFNQHMHDKSKRSEAYGVNKLKTLAKIIGAVPDKVDKNCIILKTPLPAPQPLVRRGRKK